MKTPHLSEYYAIVVATMTLLVVLVACYISIQLYRTKHSSDPGACGGNSGTPRSPGIPTTASATREGFLAPMFYNPTCRADFLRDTRAQCRGYTSGISPSIEDGMEGGWLCPGLLGTQP